MVDAAAGVDEVDLTARVERVLPDGVEALTGTEIIDETQNAMQEGLSFFNTFLLVFAAIGLVVACFTIYNTFQIVVTQRGREMALLRAVGASRRQVLAAQLLEAFFVGLCASVVGLVAGVFVAGLLKAMLERFGIDIPAGGTVLLTRTVVVAVVVGTVVTVVSAVFPALRASRTPPLAALRDVVAGDIAQPGRRLAYGAALTILGAGALVVGLAGLGIAWVGLGALTIFIGVFVLGPLIARPVVKGTGAPLPALSGITGELARENALRNPKRTARTGGALMVGVALVAAITVMSASLKDWIRDVFEEQFTGDFVVATNTFGFGGLSPQLAAELNELPEVDTATGVRVGFARVGTHGAERRGVRLGRPGDRRRDVRHRHGRGLAHRADHRRRARRRRRGRAAGDRRRRHARLPVPQRHDTHPDRAGHLHRAGHGRPAGRQPCPPRAERDRPVRLLGVHRQGRRRERRRRRDGHRRVSDAYANANLQSRSEYIDDQAAQLDQIVNLMYGLLGLAVVIALFSIANSMALSIHERTRELGLLRAVGMTRRQTRTAVRWESVLIALLGTGLGVLIGIFFGWSISVTIRGGGLATFTIPFGRPCRRRRARRARRRDRRHAPGAPSRPPRHPPRHRHRVIRGAAAKPSAGTGPWTVPAGDSRGFDGCITEHATNAEQWVPEVLVRVYRGGHVVEQRFCESPESVAEIIESREAARPTGELIVVEPHPPEVIIAVLRSDRRRHRGGPSPIMTSRPCDTAPSARC